MSSSSAQAQAVPARSATGASVKRCTLRAFCLILAAATVNAAEAAPSSSRYLWTADPMAPDPMAPDPGGSEQSLPVPMDDDPITPRMTCTGGVIAARTCYFQDLLWDTHRQRWAFFGEQHTQPHMMTDVLLTSDELDPDEPWIKLKRMVTDPPSGNWTSHEFYMDWHAGEEAPPAAEVVDAPYPAVHLRTIVNLHSIGHFLRDSLMPLVDVALRFGLDPRDFLWVMCPSNDFGQYASLRRDLPLLDHYASWIPSRPGRPERVLWTDMMADYLGEGAQGRKQRWVRFRKVLAGRGSTALDVHVGVGGTSNLNHRFSYWAHMCAPWPWRSMRALAYGNNGVPHVPAASLKPLVVLLDGHENERRQFENGEAMAEELQRELPGVEVQWLVISALTSKEQIELLARTTVLVSTIGSRSFRLVYLPDGAQMIIVSPPCWRRPNGHGSFPYPFDETDRCWGFLGYVNVLRHHVVMGALAERPQSEAGDYIALRDKAVTLVKEDFLPIVRHALDSVQQWAVPDFSTGP
eukprot:jgi/Ulvmu1/2398/UM131_0010.1